MTLQTRSYGSTGARVTVIGLGGAPLNQNSFEDGVATVRRALELGIAYFDTSPGYGKGASQAVYGEALAGRSKRYMLATKLGYFPEPQQYRSQAALWAQLEDNLRVLRRDSVDTLQVHEANWHCWWSDDLSSGTELADDLDYDFAGAPVMEVLQRAKEKGLCSFIGITGNNAEQMTRILQSVKVDTFLIAFNYDLIWRKARKVAFPVARQKQVAVILGGVFQYGRLAKVRPELLSSPPKWMTPEVVPRIERLYTLQRECGLSLVTLTIRYLLADQTMSTILAGAATPAELEESVTAAHAGPLPPELHKRVEELGLT